MHIAVEVEDEENTDNFFANYYAKNRREKDELRNSDSNGSLPIELSSDAIQENQTASIPSPGEAHEQGASNR